MEGDAGHSSVSAPPCLQLAIMTTPPPEPGGVLVEPLAGVGAAEDLGENVDPNTTNIHPLPSLAGRARFSAASAIVRGRWNGDGRLCAPLVLLASVGLVLPTATRTVNDRRRGGRHVKKGKNSENALSATRDRVN